MSLLMGAVREVFLEHGFVEAEKAGDSFRWYEFPPRSVHETIPDEKGSTGRWAKYPVYVRAQWYGPVVTGELDEAGRQVEPMRSGGELQIWLMSVPPFAVFDAGREIPLYSDGAFAGYLYSKAELEREVRTALILRHRVALQELVRWDDPRVPAMMREVLRSPYRDTREPAEMVFSDMLLQAGVPF